VFGSAAEVPENDFFRNLLTWLFAALLDSIGI